MTRYVDNVVRCLGRPEGLPVQEALPAVAEALAGPGRRAVLSAPPGSGKTLVGPVWLQEHCGFPTVWVLVPRRVTARLPYLTLKPALGSRVGYRIRFEKSWSEHTNVGYLTYGTALRLWADRPPAAEDLVIFDEFHERPWEADLLWAVLGSGQQVADRGGASRGPHRLLMTATLERSGLPFDLPVVESDGALHPVETSWEEAAVPSMMRDGELAALIARRSEELSREAPGGQLIFLPGWSSLVATREALMAKPQGGPIRLLHSRLSELEIAAALRPSPSEPNRRILATNIAESSVTIEGIRSVLDSGLERRPKAWRPGLGTALETTRAPLSSLTQRAGRAGRLGPGRCHRLFTRGDELHREPFPTPEIQRMDPYLLALSLLLLGYGPEAAPGLDWLLPPPSQPTQAWERGYSWLSQHGLSSPNGGPTDQARALFELGASPAHGLVALQAVRRGWEPNWAVTLLRLLEEETPGSAPGAVASVQERIVAEGRRGHRLPKEWVRPHAALTQQWRSQARPEGGEALSRLLLDTLGGRLYELRAERAVSPDPERPALSCPDLSRDLTRDGWRFLLALKARPSPGGAFTLELYHPVSDEAVWEWGFERLRESQVRRLDPERREVRLLRTVELELDGGSLMALEESQERAPADAETAELLARFFLREPPPGWQTFRRRLELLMGDRPELSLVLEKELGLQLTPDSDLLEQLELALLRAQLAGHSDLPVKLAEQLPRRAAVALPYRIKKLLEEELPTEILLPGRRRPHPIEYPPQGQPVLAAKLQDLMGWHPPKLLQGRLKLTFHLLAPNGRPAQITDDLAGFWRGSYAQVRRDLRGRYPKHHWPEPSDLLEM